MATKLARILMGKHKPIYTPSVDTGDFVVVINAGKILLTGDKARSKMLYRHSGYPGGLKQVPYGKLMQTRPELVVTKAVRGMLPKSVLGRKLIRKLKVYAGPDHPHKAQEPEPLELN
jgi:large subunit ribosomal protein L13